MRRSPFRVAVVGAGMAGVAAAIRLRQWGADEVVVYEKAGSVGGTWRENTYPGVACDVPSHLYSYSFAPNPEWTRTFSPGAEILAYFEGVARSYGVDRDVVFGAEVSSLRYDRGRWHVTLLDGARDVADVVVAATGVLHHPHLPDLAGLGTFAGPSFHSARFDHSVPLAGARLGVVGTGSSAVQITAALAGTVGRLELFQRTPQWILPVPNPPVPEEDRARFRADPRAMAVLRRELSAAFTEAFANAVVDAGSDALHRLQDVCAAHLDQVADPVLRERLRPTYRAGCKRLVVSDGFYDAVQRPDVALVTEPIAQVEPRGVRTADGALHELDVLVLATGFRVDRFLRPIDVTGRGGARLDDRWAARPSAYLSVSVPDFPNLFLLDGPNGPVGNFSLIDVVEAQLGYLEPLVGMVADGSCAEVAARPEALERFEAARVEAARRTVWVTGCQSWYLDDRGVPAAWPWRFERFREAMAHPVLGDYELVAAPA